MKPQKSKLSYQQPAPPNDDTAPPSQQQIIQHQHSVPIEPAQKTLPIPSQQILPQDPYRNYLKKREFQYNQSGSLIINSNNLRLLCIKEGLYEEPDLNKKLYLHFKCIQKIQNLHEYINLKTLYLQNNVIRKIQNLQCLPLLQNLFLQHNMIIKIQNLQNNKNLMVINLSYNNIFTIQGLSQLPHLQNLTITNNYLEKFQSVSHLGQCTNQLTSIDLSRNRIVGDVRLFDIVGQVKCLYLQGNPFVREVEHYRRNIVGRLKNLMYLDQRAVAADQRFLAEKWVEQGAEGLKKAKAQLEQKKLLRKQEQKKQIMKDINTYRKKKIIIFQRSITQLQKQIQKLKQYQSDPENANMQYYYTSQIDEKETKIRQYQGYIQSNTCMIEGREPPKRKEQSEEGKKIGQELFPLAIQESQSEKAINDILAKQQSKQQNEEPSAEPAPTEISQTPTQKTQTQQPPPRLIQPKKQYSYDELD